MQKLRIGILLDSLEVPAWAAKAIQRIAQGDAAEFALVILAAAPDEQQPSSRHHGLYSMFDAVDRKLFGRTPDPFAAVDIKRQLPGVPHIQVIPASDGDHHKLQAPDVDIIRQHHLDIVFKIGPAWLECGEETLATYGAWHYYHGDDTRMAGGPAGFWEVVEGQPETGTALLAEGGQAFAKRVLYRSYFFTYPLSPARHRSYYFWAAASFLPRQIELLKRVGEQEFWRRTEHFNTPKAAAIKQYEIPTGPAAAIAIAKIASQLLRGFFKRAFYLDRWFLLYSLHNGSLDGLGSFESLMPPKDRYWADPHIVQREGKYYIFVEEFLRSKNKGHISVIELDGSGKSAVPVTVLEHDSHLSYPFVFEWAGKYYMVPESAAKQSIDLYESVEFPWKWEFKRTLMQNVRAVDTTLLRYMDRWWLFTAIAETPAAAPNAELFLFSSDNLLDGQWKSHPQNPIVSDVKRARPAGAIFVQDGKLIRPSQDCTKGYGYGFDLNEIEVLSETEYCERATVSVRPNWDKNLIATHTYAKRGGLTVIDVFSPARRIG